MDSGVRHTGAPDRAWFTVREGHGFATATTHIAWRDPPFDDDTRRRREEERLRLREEDGRRNTATRREGEPGHDLVLAGTPRR
jgi:hypothetical protein